MIDGADTAWILTSTALVLFMTLPGLALFYAGLVRSQNVLSVLMHCFSIACLASVMWLAGVYSLAFGAGNAWIGDFSKVGLSGITPEPSGWTAPAELPPALRALFAEVGRTHAPFLLANAEAVDRKAEKVETEIAGRPWVQKPFPYQRKCLAWLRESYGHLDESARKTVDAVLDGTGCETLFS